MFAAKGTPSNPVIAGRSAGKTVTITPQAEPVYKEIRNLAKSGNYWAQITVNALHQLVSGRLHQAISLSNRARCTGVVRKSL